MDNIPGHVAIIPDGNRRWARKQGLLPFMGHWEGAKAAEKILQEALDLGIPYLTLWIGSVANLTERPKTEIKVLFEIYEQYFKKLVKHKSLYENGIRVRVLGRWEEIVPESVQKAVREVMEKTKDHTSRHFTIMLAYTGMDEMTSAVRKIAEERVLPDEIDQACIKQHLWTRDLPPVDLMIRTGLEGDPHLSAGFMMWDAANAQLHFTETAWPAFSPEEFRKMVTSYGKRERRMGK